MGRKKRVFSSISAHHGRDVRRVCMLSSDAGANFSSTAAVGQNPAIWSKSKQNSTCWADRHKVQPPEHTSYCCGPVVSLWWRLQLWIFAVSWPLLQKFDLLRRTAAAPDKLRPSSRHKHATIHDMPHTSSNDVLPLSIKAVFRSICTPQT